MLKQLGYMAIDQYGQVYHMYSAVKHPRKWLLNRFGRQHCSKMYVDDDKTGEVRHVGYIIAGLWLTIYRVYAWK